MRIEGAPRNGACYNPRKETAMTTAVNSIEDLVRVLDEHPEWLEALRARLLTRELLELPARLAEFAAATEQAMAEHGRILTGHGEILTGHGEMLAEHGQILAEHGQILTEHGSAIKGLRDDIGPLKGWLARTVAVNDAYILAKDMGLSWVRTLATPEIGALLDSADSLAEPKNVLRSFLRADLIMEATGENGESRYVAVEVSFTANGRDTSRALRNAELLTRLTGRPARAAIASFRLDDRIRPRIESGEVYWHELSDHLLEMSAE